MEAPAGAGAYVLREEPKSQEGHERFSVSYLFITDRDQNALATYMRAKKSFSIMETETYKWEPLGMPPYMLTQQGSPEEQASGYAVYTFVKIDGSWYPEDADLASILGVASQNALNAHRAPVSTLAGAEQSEDNS